MTLFFIFRPLFLYSITENQNLYWNYFTLLSSPNVWFCIIVSTVASILPDICLKVIENLKRKRKYTTILNKITIF